MISLEPGKQYRTRDGRKARVVCVDLKGGMYPVIALLDDRGIERVMYHHSDGRMAAGIESPGDLTAEWTDPVVFDWSALPAWANKFVAMDESDEWHSFADTPVIDDETEWIGTLATEIPAAYAPKNYTGPWQESLLVREGAV